MSSSPGGLLAVGGLLLILASGCAGSDAGAGRLAFGVPDTVAVDQVLPVFSGSASASASATGDGAFAQIVASEPPMPLIEGGVIVRPLVAAADAPDAPAPVLRRATFVFSGDTLPHSPVVRAANTFAGGAGFDFAPMFARIASVISAADLAVCHLETPIAPPGSALSTYPQYGVPAEVTVGLASAGYDRCSTASNHTIDRGVAGIDATVDALAAVAVSQAGMARNPAEATVALLDVNGINVAHLSFTMDLNGGHLPISEPWRSNIISADAVIAAAQDARARGADVVIVSLHWGTERRNTPNDFQIRIADAVTASGAVDLIVGHHAHVIQPIQQINDRWVVFGLGNFLSNMPTGDTWPASTQDGMMVTTAITEQADGTFVVDRPVVVPTWVDRSNGFVIRPVIADLADPSVSDAVKAQLSASLARTSAVVGEFVTGSG
ncbi:MAG: CapA family protein [Ilumatobacteraceae bacterium]